MKFSTQQRQLRQYGVAYLSAADSGLLDSDPEEVVDTWDELVVDQYLRGEEYERARRYSRCIAHLDDAGKLAIELVDCPEFVQHTDENRMFNGVSRKFAQCGREFTDSSFLARAVQLDMAVACGLDSSWEIGVHQIRVKSGRSSIAKPTPEGLHNDGHSFVAIHMISRHNVMGAESRVYESRSATIPTLARTLVERGETLIIDDQRMLHEVTAMTAQRGLPGHRDILIVDLIRRI